MTSNELTRVQAYLRKTFGNDNLTLKPGRTRDGMAEVLLGEEFIATLHRDEDEGEVSYTLTMSILDIDLPAATEAAPTRAPTVERKRPRRVAKA